MYLYIFVFLLFFQFDVFRYCVLLKFIFYNLLHSTSYCGNVKDKSKIDCPAT